MWALKNNPSNNYCKKRTRRIMAKAKLVTLRLPADVNQKRADSGCAGIRFISGLDGLGEAMCTELGIVGLNLTGGSTICNTKRRMKPVIQYLRANSEDAKSLEAKFTVEGRHVPLDKKWENEARDSNLEDTDQRFCKPNTFFPPLPLDCQIDRTNDMKKFNKEPSKPYTFCSCEEYNLTTVKLTPNPAVKIRMNYSFEAYRSRPRINNRSDQKTQTYADPACGASASFLRRLSRISSLEGETVRQERLRKLKKNRMLEM